MVNASLSFKFLNLVIYNNALGKIKSAARDYFCTACFINSKNIACALKHLSIKLLKSSVSYYI